MKFTSIRLEGLNAIDIPIINATASDLYILKTAEGLGPPEIDVAIAASRNVDGYYKGRNTQYREIVLTIGLNHNYKENVMISDLRTNLYGLLSAGSSDSTDVVIVNEGTNVMRTTGYIKKMEIVPFSVTPEVQITIACLKSYFVDQNDVYVDVNSTSGFLEITNKGTAETGLIFEVKANTTYSPGFIITDNRQNTMWIKYTFQVNDVLKVDTRPGSRSIILENFNPHTQNLQSQSLLHCLSTDSNWVSLYSGTNRLSFFASVFDWTEFYYTPQYWGI